MTYVYYLLIPGKKNYQHHLCISEIVGNKESSSKISISKINFLRKKQNTVLTNGIFIVLSSHAASKISMSFPKTGAYKLETQSNDKDYNIAWISTTAFQRNVLKLFNTFSANKVPAKLWLEIWKTCRKKKILQANNAYNEHVSYGRKKLTTLKM